MDIDSKEMTKKRTSARVSKGKEIIDVDDNESEDESYVPSPTKPGKKRRA